MTKLPDVPNLPQRMFSSAAYARVRVSLLGTKDIIKIKTHCITWVEVIDRHCAPICFMNEASFFFFFFI